VTIEEAAQVLLEGKVTNKCPVCKGIGIRPDMTKPLNPNGTAPTTFCKTCLGARVVYDKVWLIAWETINPGDVEGRERLRGVAVARFWKESRLKL